MLLVACSVPVTAQIKLLGKVRYRLEQKPASNATIELRKHNVRTFADQAGNFSLSLPNANDTLLISTVGYETIKVSVADALKNPVFELTEKEKALETVTVYNVHQTVGSIAESVGYFRSWRTEKTGGEIGRIFQLPYKGYKIDKIRFKASNLCDTCYIRLHIRNVVNGEPAEEVIRDSIAIRLDKVTLDDKASEFDISGYDFTFTQQQLFVSLEVLHCGSRNKEACSFCFAGTEKGEYIYKSKKDGLWIPVDDYTVYLKLFLRY